MDSVIVKIPDDSQEQNSIINENAVYKYDNDNSVMDNEEASLLVQFHGSNTSFKTKMVKSISVPKVFYSVVRESSKL